MSSFWRNWLTVWCGLVVAFGVLLLTTAFAATDGLAMAVIDLMNGQDPIVVTGPLRFAFALMGAVSLGWGLTLLIAFHAAHLLSTHGHTVWRSISGAILAWYVIDSGLSVATGFALNAVSNTILLILYLVPIVRTGVLHRETATAAHA